MKTQFLDLTTDIANIFVKIHENTIPLSSSEIQLVNDFLTQIDTALSSLQQNSSSNQSFVRCSSRSPKDSRVSIQKCKETFEKEITKANSDNDKLIALLKSSLAGLCVTNSKEVLDLLTSSKRIYEDFSQDLVKIKQSNSLKFTQNVILREWVNIPIEMEFRGFVYQKKLTALSQYYHTVYFPHLKDQISDIIEKIKSFWNDELINVIPIETSIVDFAVLETRILVIELNPFAIATDPALFSWKTDLDILEGREPFESRITQHPLPITKGIQLAIEDLMSQ
eukprot:TRINITY_DN8318_c0_g1_i2.p1 TRINITY_DN8318_c0_g1~~TRINITY_DN8318_c0_g1_i2.p1  ORF type:complete len:281 (-),score=36.93 TRINITY_DN8318_c0_g1_i2:67-909(-)